MEAFVNAILLTAMLKYCLKAAHNGSLGAIFIYSGALALASLAICPAVVNSPADTVRKLLSDPQATGNWAVLVTAEAAAGILISVKLLDNYFRPSARRSRMLRVLKVTPGILCLAGTWYYELEFFRMRAGAGFLQTALIYAALVFVVLSLLSLCFRLLLKGESAKLELKMLLNLGILAGGLLVNSSTAGYSKSSAVADTDWAALGAITAIALALAGAGLLLHKYSHEIKRIVKIRNGNNI